MIKRAVIRAPARGYVDGRFIGEEKEPADSGRARGKGGAGRRGKANTDSVLSGDNIGNTTAKRRTRSGTGTGAGKGRSAGGAGGRTRGASGVAGAQGARADGRADGRTDGRKRSQGQSEGQGQPRGSAGGQGRRQSQPRASGQARGQGLLGQGQGQGQGQTRGQTQSRDPNRARGQGQGQRQGQRGPRAGGLGTGGLGVDGQGTSPFISDHGDPSLRGAARTKQRRGSTGKKSPFRTGSALTHEVSPTQGADLRRLGDEAKSGQFAEALAASANVKRERLHKVLAQSGHGSRRDMEIMISSGRVMVNGIVATAGTQVAPGDNVLVDQRHVKLKFTEDTPRVLLYHKPEGEIVTTNDPGNRITVFDNLPRVETGKWVAIGRLDINTSGLLIFTTSGELANRFMHPRYEVEREYAVRILGELTEEQTHKLLAGVKIEDSKPKGNEDDDDRFNRMDAGADQDADEDDDDEIYDFELDEEVLPPVASQVTHGEDQQLHHDSIGNQAVDAVDGESTDAEPLDAQPLDFDGSDNQPLDARFLGNATTAAATAAAFLRNPLAKFDVIEKRGGEGVNQWYHVVIREGRNREVRKMFESLGLTVSRLIRTRFGKVELPPRLLRGKMVELDESQVRSVLASAGMKVDGPVMPLSSRGKNAGPRAPREKQDASRDQNKPREPNRARQQKPRMSPEGMVIDEAGGASPRTANNNRRRASGERNTNPRNPRTPNRPRFAPPSDINMTEGNMAEGNTAEGNIFANADGAGHGNRDGNGNRDGDIDQAVDGNAVGNAPSARAPRGSREGADDRNNARRGRSNTRGGRGRRPPRDAGVGAGASNTDPQMGGSMNDATGNRADNFNGEGFTGNTGEANPTARPDNRTRGKSRRTLRGRRRPNTGAGTPSEGGNNDSGNNGNGGNNTGGSEV